MVFMQSTRYSCQISMKLEFSLSRFSKNTQMSNFMNMRPVAGELFRADGRTDMTRLIVAFRSFANAPNNALYGDCIGAPAAVSLVSAPAWLHRLP